MVPSKSYERVGKLMMADLGRNTRQYTAYVAGVGVFDCGVHLRVDECSS